MGGKLYILSKVDLFLSLFREEMMGVLWDGRDGKIYFGYILRVESIGFFDGFVWVWVKEEIEWL